MKTALTIVVACSIALPAAAQVDPVLTPPPNLALPNYYTVPVGPFGGLEGNAYAARVGDPSAAWFNPAGLARHDTAQISGSAGAYQWTTVTPGSLGNQGGSLQNLPNYVGFTFAPGSRVTVGAALLTSIAWSQETDTELITPSAAGQQRFAYSADSDFEQRVLAFAAGYHASENSPWRIGGGLALSLVSLRLVESTSDRVGTSTGLKSLLVSARASASALQLRSQVGVQYDTGGVRLGAAVRTPGLTLTKSASITLDGLLDAGASSVGASVFDPDAAADYHLPWEFQGGAAYAHTRFEAELDVHAFSPISTYSMIATSNPSVTYTDAGTGHPPVVTRQPFNGLKSSSDAVVNVSAGGHLRLLTNRDLRIHAGVDTSRSPVNPDDAVFNQANLVRWSLGASGTFGKLQFAAGMNRSSGTVADVTLRNLVDGQIVKTSMDVGMVGFIYSIAYQF